MRIPGTGIGENDLVAGLQAVHDFDRINRAPAQFDRRSYRIAAARNKFENADRIVFLTKCRPADKDDIIQAFQFDRTINR